MIFGEPNYANDIPRTKANIPMPEIKPAKEENIEPNESPLVFEVINKYIDNIDKLNEKEKELFLDVISMWCYPVMKMNDQINFDELIKQLDKEK
jgi:hypothetical protein